MSWSVLNVRQMPSSHSTVFDRTGVEMRERGGDHALDADLLVPLLATPARAGPLVKRNAGRSGGLLHAQDLALLLDRRLRVQRRHTLRRGKRHVRSNLMTGLAGVLAKLRLPARAEASRELAHDRKIDAPGQTERLGADTAPLRRIAQFTIFALVIPIGPALVLQVIEVIAALAIVAT